jgi:hypothetical protein
MANFLSNLLTRNIEAGPVAPPALRPRPLTQYESIPPGQPLGEMGGPVTDDPVASPPRAQQADPGLPEALDWLAAWRRQLPAEDPAPRSVSPIPLPFESIPPATAPLGVTQPPPASLPPRTMDALPLPQVIREIHPQPALAPTAPVIRVETQAPAPIQPRRLAEATRPESTPRTLAAASTRSEDRGGIQPAPRGGPQITLRQVDNPPQPIIHVNIGRIEVRANSAPQAAAPVKQRAAVMSLEEYLRRRNGGQQ